MSKAKKLPVELEGIIFSDSTSSIFLITLPFQARVCSAALELPAWTLIVSLVSLSPSEANIDKANSGAVTTGGGNRLGQV